MSRQHLKILLLQIREDPTTRQEEQDEFIRYGNLDPKQIDILDVFQTPAFTPDILQGYDALFIGGSSDATVLEPHNFPFVTCSKTLLKHSIESQFPVFASCFGFQLLVEAAGGAVIRDPDNLEMGVYPLSTTPAGKKDALFGDLPEPFLAVSGHKERALTLPPGLVNLAYSERCPYHAVRVEHCPIYGFQFHPEVDATDLKARLNRYQHRYLNDSSRIQSILESIQETPQSNQLISNFIDRILLA